MAWTLDDIIGDKFLSENAEFAQRSAECQIKFVGPPPTAITAMGSKSKSKAIMEATGVTTAPGFYGDSDEQQEPLYLLERAVQDVGFPLLIKAVMGGGGKGMRVVWSESDFLESLEACKRESLNAFGDSKVLLERFLVHPRHVEVQVVADHHGNVVSLHERDCSLQRRHQKIIEEAPASDLPDELRKKLGDMGCKAARAVGYVNAGTVEFLLESGNRKGKEGDDGFYFCEMNTRLQVEHPITELITGVDLVEWQLRVAAGEPLPITNSSEIPCSGHAFEARIYAEKPGDGTFLPASGTVWYHDPPAPPNAVGVDETSLSLSKGIRVDTGIQKGQAVGVDYDPMICKLIVHDDSREKALNKMLTALKDYRIAGVPTNIDFLIKCAQHETFRKPGATNTGFLDDHLEEVLSPEHQSIPEKAIAIASLAVQLVIEGRVGIEDLKMARRKHPTPWNSLSGSWRNSASPRQTLQLTDGTIVDCTSLRDGSYKVQVTPNVGNDEEENMATVFHMDGTLSLDHEMNVVVNGSEKLSLVAALKDMDGTFQVCLWPQSASLHNEGHYFWELAIPNPKFPSSTVEKNDSVTESGKGTLLAPMPGKISEIRLNIGDSIEEGDILVVMEAMKMEHTVRATASGTVECINCQVGEVVADQAVLATIIEKRYLEADADSSSYEEESKAI